MIETARLNSYLSKNPLHFQWADIADSLGYVPTIRPDDSRALSWGRLRLVSVCNLTGIDDLDNMAQMLQERPTDQEMLRRIYDRSKAAGFAPHGFPYDIAVFVLLDRLRENPRLEVVLGALPYRPELFDALCFEMLGRILERDDSDGNI